MRLRLTQSHGIVAAIVLLQAAHASYAQTTQTPPPAQGTSPDSAAAPVPSAPTAWKVGQLNVSGMVDAYYDLGFNHPADHVNELLNFDDRANQIELNMASITLDYTPGPVGFHVDAGVGRAFDIMSATEKGATGMRFFKQAYIDIKPASWKGLEVDVGRFVSFASAEVIETPNNWNYSHSLLFVWCTPYYHFGIRATAPVGGHFNTGFELVSGWNNIVTGGTYKTVGWTGSWAPNPEVTWTNTYYGGPDENTANRGLRNLYDTVLLLAPNPKVNLYFNFDYLHNTPHYTPGYQVYGIAGAAKFPLTRKLSLSLRLEWLNDNTGLATGMGQQVKELTLTGTYALLDRLSLWMEFRNDWSNQPFFGRGNPTALTKDQPTALLGLTASLGPKREAP